MANTLTSLVPDLYQAMDTVSRELVGLIPAVSRNSSVERASLNQVIRSHVAPASTASDITPGQLPPDSGDQTIGNKTLSITKSRAVPIRWNGEEQKGINHGSGYQSVLGDQFAQAIRTLTNEMESDLASLYSASSRAFGVAATTPFASSLIQAAEARKILVDNGAPINDLQLVVDTTAGVKLRTLTQLTNVNQAASSTLLRQGVLAEPVLGMSIRESAAIGTHTAGTASSATTDNAGYAVGSTVITLDSAGTGTILAGDNITFAGDTNKYVVVSGDADVSGGGTITIAAPGLKMAMSAATKAITVSATSTSNMLFDRNAIQLVTRAPALPTEGDRATDSMIITDPRSGISYEVRVYSEYRQVHYEIAAAWGFANMKTEHSAILLG